MGGICQEPSKSIDVILEVIFPEKIAHMSRGGEKDIFHSLQGHLAVASKGHGVFKGVMRSVGRLPKAKRRRDAGFARGLPKQY